MAALLVVAVHAGDMFSAFGIPHFGGVGVDLFFVISGFIMIYVTRDKKVTPVHFATDRIVRIVPMYWIMTFLVFGLAIVAPRLFQNTRGDFVELMKSLFFIPFLKGGVPRPVLFVGWTLNYEMFFYLMFSIGLVLPYRIGVALVMAVMVAFAALGSVFHFHDVLLSFYANLKLAEFAAGMGIGLIYPYLPSPKTAAAKFGALAGLVVGLACLVTLQVFITDDTPKTLANLVSACVVMVSALCLEKGGWSVQNKWILTLGNASYSLYLTHALIAIAAVKVFVSHGAHIWLALVMLPLTYIVCIVVGVCAYTYVEKPVTQWLRSRIGNAAKSLRVATPSG